MHTGFYKDHDELQEFTAGFYFLENEDKVQDMNLYDFLHGYCEFFAQHLHNKYGYEIESIMDADGALVHCYGVRYENGKPIFADIRGETDYFPEFIREFEDELYGTYTEQYQYVNVFRRSPNLEKYQDKEKILAATEEITQKYNFWRRVA